MSQETVLIQRYFDACNHHDLEAVITCFDDTAIIVAARGRRIAGGVAMRDYYASTVATFHDARCTLRTLVGADGTGAMESLCTTTRPGAPQPRRSMGVEVIECRVGKIAARRDYTTVGDHTH